MIVDCRFFNNKAAIYNHSIYNLQFLKMVELKQNLRVKTTTEPAHPSLLRPALTGLVVAAVLELLLWRTFSRIGVFIPKKGAFQEVYRILGLDIGVIFLNLSVILSVAVFGMTAVRLRETGQFSRTSDRVQAGLWSIAFVAITMVLGLTFFELFPRQEIPVVSLVLRLALLVSFGSLGAIYWRTNPRPIARLFVGLLVAAYGFQIVAKLIEDRFLPLPAGLNPNDVYVPLLLVGEGAVLVNGIVLYVLYGTNGERPARSLARHWPSFLGAVGLTSLFLGLTFLTVAESDIVPILGLYALGYTMQLPLALYVIGLFFALYTIFFNLGGAKKSYRQRAVAFGMILILVGGYQFNLSNQYLFALIGVLLLARPELCEK